MHLRLFPLLFVLVTTTVAAAPCTLDRKVLLPYEQGASATAEEWRESRRAILDFTYCDPRKIDRASRRLLFDVVRAQFDMEQTPALKREAAKWLESKELGDELRILEHRLRATMDRIVTPADTEHAETILAYGSSKAIASLGPAVQREVLRQLGNPGRPYGVSRQYDAKFEALGALGYWIDPANRSFSAEEKGSFVSLLTSLLQTSDVVRNAAHARMLTVAFRALSRSDDAAAGEAVRPWMEKQRDPAQWLSDVARETAESIEKNAASRRRR